MNHAVETLLYEAGLLSISGELREIDRLPKIFLILRPYVLV